MKGNGFSLVELIVVIAIVGILAAIVSPIYSSYVKKSKIASTFPVVEGLANNIKQYYGVNSKMPTIMSQVGFSSNNSQYPEELITGFPASVNDYASPPNLMGLLFGGTDAAPGACAQFAISSYVTNYDKTGALTASNGTADYIFIYNTYVLTNDGSWKVFCQAIEPNNMNTDDYSDVVSGCFNMATGFGSTEINNAITMCQ